MAFVQAAYPQPATNTWQYQTADAAAAAAQQQYYYTCAQYGAQAQQADPYTAYYQQQQQQQYTTANLYVYDQSLNAASAAPALPLEAPPPLPATDSKSEMGEEVPPPPPGDDPPLPPLPPASAATDASVLAPPTTMSASIAATLAPTYDAAAAAAYYNYYGQYPYAQGQYDYSQYYAQQQQQQHHHQHQYAANPYWQAQAPAQQHAAYDQQQASTTCIMPSSQEQAAVNGTSAVDHTPARSPWSNGQPHAGTPGPAGGVMQTTYQTGSATCAAVLNNPAYTPSNTGKGISGATIGLQCPADVPHNTFNAVPPPSSLAASGNMSQQAVRRPGFAIKPQQGRTLTNTPAVVSVPLVTSKSGGTPLPSYTRATSAAIMAPAPARPAGSKFPPAFGAWVERCFASCRTDAQRQVMTAGLSKKIKECEAQGRMWLTDWDTEPLPLLNDPPVSGTPTVTPRSGGVATTNDERSTSTRRDRWGEPSTGAASSYGRDRRSSDASADTNGVLNSIHDNDSSRGVVGRRRHDLERPAVQYERVTKKQRKAAAAQERARAASAAVFNTRAERAEAAKANARAGRFGDGRADGAMGSRTPCSGGASLRPFSSMSDEDSSEDIDFSSITIKGTCQELEKSFFRLTDAPDPASVRPEPVLEAALGRLVGMLQRQEATYFYALDQFKGMRQDCTVQHLRNALAVKVYEAHARSSLEYGESAEFNQCQTQLHAMYADGVPGCRAEFLAYKLLYQTLHARRGLNKSLLATMQLVASDSELSKAPAVLHALKVRAAVMTSDAPTFFQLYALAPNMGRAMMDGMATKVRWNTLNTVLRSYGKVQNLPLPFLAQLLGFTPLSQGCSAAAALALTPARPLPGCSSAVYVGRAAPAATEAEGLQACYEWLLACSVAMVATGNTPGAYEVDMKAPVELTEPKEAAKVAHGDENLSMEDFLASARARSRA